MSASEEIARVVTENEDLERKIAERMKAVTAKKEREKLKEPAMRSVRVIRPWL